MESALHEIAPAGLKVIETFRCDPETGFVRFAAHLDRAEATCARLDIPFDRMNILTALNDIPTDTDARVRMTIDQSGQVSATHAPISTNKEIWHVDLSPTKLDPRDPWLSVKTTQRSLYDAARAELAQGTDELIFENTDGFICEGTITNIFVEDGAHLLTPSLECGLLPGILRAELIASGRASEASLTISDLKSASAFYLGNSLRGLIKGQML